LEFFRILFGAVMVWEVSRYLRHGWVADYNDQENHLHFPGFGWVEPLPHEALVAFFIAMGLLGLMICVGFLTRFAAIAYFIGFIYWFNLEATDYLNHLYLVALLSFVVAVLPLGRSMSVDAWLFKRDEPTTPRWTLEILRWQVGLVYLYGGLAKCNPDWLQAQPLIIWLEDYCERSWPGELIAEPETAWFLSYMGLGIDLIAFPCLLWKRTRVWTMLVLLCFHMSNAWLFQIGIFPWLMSGALLLYLDPDWPRRLLALVRSDDVSTPVLQPGPSGFRGPAAIFFSVWIAGQIGIPLRHLFYPGRPSWTEEGHWFAWHMKLRSKSSDIAFFIEDLDSGEVWMVDLDEHFDRRQQTKLGGHPEWIRQTAWHLARAASEDGHPNTRVTADAWASLNGREYQRLVDPDVDLSAISFEWSPADWIVPLDPDLKLNPESKRSDPCP
jgi:hypothetical protein